MSININQPIFRFDTRKGSFRDHVSGVIPANTNAVIKKTDKGRAVKLNSGSIPLKFTNLKIGNNLEGKDFTIVSSVFSPRTTATPPRYLIHLGSSSERLYVSYGDVTQSKFSITVGIGNETYKFTSVEYNNKWCHIILDYTYATNTINLYVNNAYFNSHVFTGTKTFGNEDAIIGYNYSVFKIRNIDIYDGIATATQRQLLYNELSHYGNIHQEIFIKYPSTHTPANRDVFLYETLLNHNAEGITRTAGKYLNGDWIVDSGSFKVGEETGGEKYIECVTDGAISTAGVDLSSLTGNGYIKTMKTSGISSDAEDTVDNATNVAFANNTITVSNFTTGDKLYNLIIQRGATV